MVEVWTVSRPSDQGAHNPWLNLDIVTRTAQEHERLAVFGEDTLVGNVVLPVSPVVEGVQHFGASNQESAINLLVERHPHDPRIREVAEALVWSL